MDGKFQNINYDIDTLPPMPLIATRIVELLNSPRSSAEEMAKVISADPAVSARVLKIANSSFYSMARQVKTLSTAIVILGEKTLKNLVLAASLRGVNANFGAVERMLWEDSMTCALGARFLSRSLRMGDPEEAFIAGLFRHIGRVILNNQDPEGYQQILGQEKCCGARLIALEEERFGIGHAALGAAVLEQWQLSGMMSLVALHHHEEVLADISAADVRSLAAIVNIAGEFPLFFGILGDCTEMPEFENLPGVKALGLESEELSGLFNEFKGVFAENRESFLS